MSVTIPVSTATAAAARRGARRPRRWLRVCGIAASVVAIVLAALWFAAVPRFVRTTLVSRLVEAGFTGAAVGSVSVGFSRVEIRDLQLAGGDPGGGTVSVPLAIADFRWSDVVAGRVDGIVLERPVWTRSAVNGVSPFDGFAGAAGAASGVGEGPLAPRVLPALPFRRVAIRGAAIVGGGDDAHDATIDAELIADGERWAIEAAAADGARSARAKIELAVPAAAAGSAVEGSVQLDVSGSETVQLTGTCRVSVEAGERRVAASLQRGEGPLAFARGDRRYALAGDVKVRVDLPFARLANAECELLVADGSLTAMSDFELRGIDARLHLFGLPRPESRQDQVVRWREVHAGKIAGGAGEATLQLRAGPEVSVRVRQHTADGTGTIDLDGLRWVPDETTFAAKIVLTDVPLQDWLELASGGRITGDGRLSGSFALMLATEPRFAIDLRDGRLAAAPGGTVRFLDDPDTDQLIRQHVQQVATASGHDALVQDRLVNALKEFRYSDLRFQIDRDEVTGGVTLRVHVAGEGRIVPQQLDLDLNLHGFDTAIDTALAIKLGLDRAKDRLDRRIDGATERPPEKKP